MSGTPETQSLERLLLHLPALESLTIGGFNGLEVLKCFFNLTERSGERDLGEKNSGDEHGDGLVNAGPVQQAASDKLDATMNASPQTNGYCRGLRQLGLRRLELMSVNCRRAELAQVLLRYGTKLDKIIFREGILECDENQWPALMRELHQGLPRCRFELSGVFQYQVFDDYISWRLNVGDLVMSTGEEFARGIEQLGHFVHDEEAYWQEYADSEDT